MSKTYSFPDDGNLTAPVSSIEPTFPTHWRDLDGWKAHGIELSSPSNEAVKLYDALLHQAIYHYNDPILGGFGGTSKKMMEADPDFAMGQIFTLGMEVFAANPKKNADKRKKLVDFSKKAKTLQLTKYEKDHLVAAEMMMAEDFYGAMNQFDSILDYNPLDPFALQMGYFLALTIGQTKKLHDIPAKVVKSYNPSTPFYGHVYGKLCFGQGENGDYTGSEISGRLALDHFPLDNWAHHALAHNFEESGRPLQGRKFLGNTQGHWTQGTTFSHHIWWHCALFHVQMGEYEAALTLYDDIVGPMTLKDSGNFPLSDGSSLLLRLQLEGVDIGDRAVKQSQAWKDHDEDFVSLFYDGHACFTSLLAGDREACNKHMDNMREFIKDERTGWNKDITTKVGIPLLEGIGKYMDGDYGSAVDLLAPIMPELQEKIQGSRAQKDIFQQILLHAAAKSAEKKNVDLALDILSNKLKDGKLERHTPLNQRFYEKIMASHQA